MTMGGPKAELILTAEQAPGGDETLSFAASNQVFEL